MHSAFDRRRINGPEQSWPVIFDENPTSSKYESIPSCDRVGRKSLDLRPIYLKTGLTSQANGSAYIEMDKTKIACAVYGPRQSKSTAFSEKGKLNVDVKFAPFSCIRRKIPNRDAEDRTLGTLIHQALLPSIRLELFPKSSIDVFVTVLESDGAENCLAASSIVVSTALANAGIELLALVVSCSASIAPNDEIWLDVTDSEAAIVKGSFTLACMPALDQITSVWQTGELTPEQIVQCMEHCNLRSQDIHAIVAQALHDSVKQ